MSCYMSCYVTSQNISCHMNVIRHKASKLGLGEMFSCEKCNFTIQRKDHFKQHKSKYTRLSASNCTTRIMEHLETDITDMHTEGVTTLNNNFKC